MRVEPAGALDILIVREFHAPRRLVFDAHTRPELLRRWYGPHGWRLDLCEIELWIGGSWHYLLRGPGASEMTLRGTYLDLLPPERIVTTESNVDCEARSDFEAIVTIVLEEHSDHTAPPRTTLTNTTRFPTRGARDAVLRSGMDHGITQGFDRLDALLRNLIYR
jgi:uncharacterized protein YndB with AHSA1/START domain